MCTEVVIDDKWIDTCKELAAALGCGLDELVDVDGELPASDNDGQYCLCGVDIEATAKKFGYTAKQDWKTGCGEYVFTKVPKDG